MRQLTFLFMLLILFSCKKERTLNSEAQIVNIHFDFGDAVVDDSTKTGTVDVPENTDLTKLVPEIEISPGATIFPPSGVATDFSKDVVYTVNSEDRTTKNIYTISAHLPVMKFQVFDATNCSETNPTPLIAAGTTLKFYLDSKGEKVLSKELDSDENGQALFYGEKNKVYLLQANNNGAVNIFHHYIIQGVFQTQEDLNNYKYLSPNARVGDLILKDLNGDGRLTSDDQTDYQPVFNSSNDQVITINIYVSKDRESQSF